MKQNIGVLTPGKQQELERDNVKYNCSKSEDNTHQIWTKWYSPVECAEKGNKDDQS